MVADPLALLADRLDPPQHATTDEYASPGALERHLDPGAWSYPHLARIDEHLVALEQRSIGTRGLMIFVQPRAGKSRRCARHFPLWYLRRHRDHQVLLATYGQRLADGHSRWIRNAIRAHPGLGLALDPTSQRVCEWQLSGHEGGLRSVGVGGSVTGTGADLIVIDDPVKSREQAESVVYRDKTWDWWTDDVSTRLMTGAVALLMTTRWHEDDLAGRLLANEPEHWTVLTLPALAEPGDPLGRPEGAVLMPDRYGTDWMTEQRRRLGTYGFSALYQQRPSPAEGSLFKRAHFRYWHPADGQWQLGERSVRRVDCWMFATVDLAVSTRTSADWTVCAVWAVTPDGQLLLVDRERQRIDEGDHWPMVRRLREKWAFAYCGVESRMFGTRLVWEAGAAGMPLRELKADVDKVTRAIPATVRCEQGRAWFPAEAPWLEEWEHELLAFPNGTHDDQVDVFAYAALELTKGRYAPDPPPATPDERFRAAIAARMTRERRARRRRR